MTTRRTDVQLIAELRTMPWEPPTVQDRLGLARAMLFGHEYSVIQAYRARLLHDIAADLAAALERQQK